MSEASTPAESGNSDSVESEGILDYKKPDILRQLYHEEKLTQKEIGEQFGVSQNAIAYWLDKFDIDPPSRVGPDIQRWVDGQYTYISDGNEIVHEHRLAAIADGADPYEVFSDDSTVVHHETHRALNLPATVAVHDEDFHRDLHYGRGIWRMGDDGIPRFGDTANFSNLMVPIPTGGEEC